VASQNAARKERIGRFSTKRAQMAKKTWNQGFRAKKQKRAPKIRQRSNFAEKVSRRAF